MGCESSPFYLGLYLFNTLLIEGYFGGNAIFDLLNIVDELYLVEFLMVAK